MVTHTVLDHEHVYDVRANEHFRVIDLQCTIHPCDHYLVYAYGPGVSGENVAFALERWFVRERVVTKEYNRDDLIAAIDLAKYPPIGRGASFSEMRLDEYNFR